MTDSAFDFDGLMAEFGDLGAQAPVATAAKPAEKAPRTASSAPVEGKSKAPAKKPGTRKTPVPQVVAPTVRMPEMAAGESGEVRAKAAPAPRPMIELDPVTEWRIIGPYLYLPDAFEVVVCDPTGELDWVTEFGPARYATTAADIATAMREVTDSLDRRHTLLASHASERIETLPRLSAEGEPIDVPRRLLVVLNQIGTITDGDPMVLHAEGRGALDQVLMLGRAAGIHVIASVRRPSAFTTAGHSLLYSVKVGLGWMSEPFSYLAIGTPGCADLDPVTPEDRGWFVVDGEDDVVVQMYKLPVRSHNEVGDEPERVGVVERIRQRPAHIPGRST